MNVRTELAEILKKTDGRFNKSFVFGEQVFPTMPVKQFLNSFGPFDAVTVTAQKDKLVFKWINGSAFINTVAVMEEIKAKNK